MKLTIPESQHKGGFCERLGPLAGQVPGGWSIVHEYQDGNVTLTLPDGVITAAALANFLATHDPKAPSPSEQAILDNNGVLRTMLQDPNAPEWAKILARRQGIK